MSKGKQKRRLKRDELRKAAQRGIGYDAQGNPKRIDKTDGAMARDLLAGYKIVS